MPSLAWDDCCPQTPRRSRWLESRSGRSLDRCREKGWIGNRPCLIELRIAHWIDVEFLGPFDPHLIPENAVNYSSCGVIRHARAIPVIRVCLFPYGSILQANDGPAGQPLKAAINAAHN